MKSTTKKTKINFSKFFNNDNSFISIKGQQMRADDWDVDITLQTSPGRYVNLWASEWTGVKGEIDYLKELQKGIDLTLKFIEQCQADQKAAKKPVIDKDKVIKGMKK